jgi:hypothetical protein
MDVTIMMEWMLPIINLGSNGWLAICSPSVCYPFWGPCWSDDLGLWRKTVRLVTGVGHTARCSHGQNYLCRNTCLFRGVSRLALFRCCDVLGSFGVTCGNPGERRWPKRRWRGSFETCWDAQESWQVVWKSTTDHDATGPWAVIKSMPFFAMHKSGWFQFFSSFQFPSNLNDPKFNIWVFHSISQEEGKLPGHQRWPATYRQVELRHCHCCTRLPPEGTTGKKPRVADNIHQHPTWV